MIELRWKKLNAGDRHYMNGFPGNTAILYEGAAVLQYREGAETQYFDGPPIEWSDWVDVPIED